MSGNWEAGEQAGAGQALGRWAEGSFGPYVRSSLRPGPRWVLHWRPSSPSANALRGGAGRRHRGRAGRRAAAAAALLPGAVLLAAQAGGPAEETQVGARPPRGGAPGTGALAWPHPQPPVSPQRHGEGEAAQDREGLQAWPAG